MATGYFTRSRAREEHKAAGVLPFSLHEGAVLVLLGGEPCKTGPGGKVWRTLWRDFGGGREAADADGEATAAREFAEETLGLFGTCGVNAASVALAAAAMEARLHLPGQAVKVVHALKRGAYHFFITQQAFVSPLMFRLASQQNVATKGVAGAEKTAFAWVPLCTLLECVAEAKPRYFLEARAHVCGSADTPPLLACGRRRFQLHPCFANSLRMAQRQGLEELIAQAEELPLPPPPLLPRPAAAAAAAAAVIAEPAASAQGCAPGSAGALAVNSPCLLGVAAAAAVAAAVPGSVEEGSDSEEVSSGVQESMSYWLAQAEVAAALRADTPAAEPLSSSQQQQQFAGRIASLAPASSVDTASSLRASRQAVAAAAVDQVVQQIEANSHLSSGAKHRPSRKQRQRLRRQRKAAAQRAARAAEAAEAGVPSPPAAAGKRQFPAQADDEDVPASSAQAPLSPQASPSAQQQQQQQQQEQLPPPHWQHAMLELQAAFQPRLRLQKRLRLVVAGV